MRVFRFAILVCLGVSPVVAATSPPRSKIEFPGQLEKWVQLKAAEFVICSNAGKGQTVEIAKELLRFRAALAHLSRLRISSPLPITVYAFKSTSSFAPYRDLLLEHSAKTVAGIFEHAPDGPLIVFDASGRWSTEHVVYHELVHSFTSNTESSVPLWFGEGLAEFWAAFQVKDGKVAIGMPLGWIDFLKKHPWQPLRDVLTADAESRIFRDKNLTSTFYGESWGMVHYLMMDCPARRGQLTSYLDQVAAKRPVDQAFQSAFGTSIEKFEKELKAYLGGTEFGYRTLSGSDLPPITIDEPTVMPRDEILARLGYLVLQGAKQGLPTAEAFLLEAFKYNPHNIGALTGLGIVRERQGRAEEGWTFYERALEFRPNDPRPYLNAAGTLLERLETATPRSPVDAERARELLCRVVELCPDLPSAWEHLGHTYALVPEGDVGPGIDALERCLALAPNRFRAARDLVVLCVKDGRRERAVEVNGRFLATCPDAEIVKSAHEALILGDLQHADELRREKKLDDALTTAEQAIRTAHGWNVTDHLLESATALRDQIETEAQGEKCNRAVAMAQRGELAAALAAVEGLIPTIKDPSLLEHARRLRDQLRSPVGAGSGSSAAAPPSTPIQPKAHENPGHP